MSDDLDDILSSALDEIALDDDAVKASSSSASASSVSTAGITSSGVSSELAQAASQIAQVQDVAAKKAAEDHAKQVAEAGAAGAGGDDFEKALMGMFSGGDMDKIMEDLFKDPEMKQMMDKLLPGLSGLDVKDGETPPDPDAFFQNLMKTMGQTPGAPGGLNLPTPSDASSPGGPPSADFLGKLVNKMESELGEAGMESMLQNVMKQMMSKEVMYDPIVKITDEYPPFLARNKGTLSQEDKKRFENQLSGYTALRKIYETEPDNYDKVSQIMQDMQAFGQPPEELAKLLLPPGGAPPPPGMPGAQGMPPDMPAECKQQ